MFTISTIATPDPPYIAKIGETMNSRIKNVLLGTIATLLACAYSQAPHAQAAGGQLPEAWVDSCLYTLTNNAWQRTGWCGAYPDVQNANVFNLYYGQDAMFQFMEGQGGMISVYDYRIGAMYNVVNHGYVLDALVQTLVLEQLSGMQQSAAQPGTATIGGTSGPTLYTSNSPNWSPDAPGYASVGGFIWTLPCEGVGYCWGVN
jgi:hypothetical protein